jgi:hypothetical protein
MKIWSFMIRVLFVIEPAISPASQHCASAAGASVLSGLGIEQVPLFLEEQLAQIYTLWL